MRGKANCQPGYLCFLCLCPSTQGNSTLSFKAQHLPLVRNPSSFPQAAPPPGTLALGPQAVCDWARAEPLVFCRPQLGPQQV